MANLHYLDQKWAKEKITPNYYFEVMGWNIIPTFHGQKGNGPTQWGQLINQKIDKNFIYQYWTDNTFNKFGVAAIAGETSDLMEVDFDDENDKELWDIFLKTETLKDKTKRGGHLYFKYDPTIPAFKRGKVEVKTKGSLLVLPPTLHPTGMERYWLNDLPVAKMSDEMKEWLMNKGGRAEIDKKHSLQEAFLAGEGALDIFSNKLNLPKVRIQEGERFKFLQSMAGKIINLVGHTDEGKALGRLALHKINELYLESPEEPKKVENIYDGLLKTDLRNILDVDISLSKDKLLNRILDGLMSVNVRRNTLSFGFGPKTDMALSPLSLGELITIYGKASQGKTTFGYNVLLSAKDRFLCTHIKLENSDKNIMEDRFNRWMKQNKMYASITYLQDFRYNVLYKDTKFPVDDETHDDCVKRFNKEEVDNFLNITENVVINPIPEAIIKVIDMEISRGKKIFLIDNYTSINFPNVKGVNSTDQIKIFLRELKQKAEKHNVLFIGIAHSTRNKEQEGTGDNTYGSSHYRNISDRLIEISKPKEDLNNLVTANTNNWILSQFHVHKNRAGKKDFTIKYFYKPETGEIEIIDENEEQSKKSELNKQAIKALLS